MKKLLWISLSLTVVAVIVITAKLFLLERRIDGIDISHYNKVANWDKVKVGFIYAKATEGKTHKDWKYRSFHRNAMKRNIPFGAYHFLTISSSAKAQFHNFKSVVPKGSTTLLPMLDIEGELSIPDDSLKQIVGDWIKECHSYYGVFPILYLSPYSIYLRLIGTPNLTKCYLWSGITMPHWDIIPFLTAKIVQHRIDKVDGFNGSIDCNHLNGTIDDLIMEDL